MNDLTDFDEFGEFMQDCVDEIQGKLDQKISALIQKRLDDWRRRFPRHKFRAVSGNGAITFDISPALGYSTEQWQSLTSVGSVFHRGAIMRLCAEAENLTLAVESMEWTINAMSFDDMESAS